MMMYGCIAEKLGHSFSKDIHNRLFDYEYELKEIPKDELSSFLKKKEFKGINVTIPYKESVIPYLDWLSDTVKKIGAVNTIVNENGFLKGYNTDYSGMYALIQKNHMELKNKKVLILGSGGTSKTAMAVAETMGCSSLFRVSRNSSGNNENCITYEEARTLHKDAQVIINTTPVGMYPKIGVSPIDLNDYPKVDVVVDVVYNPLRSKLVCDAKEKGISTVGGLYMLVAQAAIAAEKFLQTEVSVSEIDRVYGELILKKQNIVLTGMPGSGKTTLGKILAKELGMTFIDTDEEIVKKEGKSISDIFSQMGESRFREIESEIIYHLSSTQNAVISTGGGSILNATNIQMLRENGKIYFLDRNINEIAATSDRPLSSTRADLEKRYAERYPLYCERCDEKISIENNMNSNIQKIKEDFYHENTCD